MRQPVSFSPAAAFLANPFAFTANFTLPSPMLMGEESKMGAAIHLRNHHNTATSTAKINSATRTDSTIVPFTVAPTFISCNCPLCASESDCV